ncbi:sirohydrochlorin chelatase [Nocardioides sp. SYSU D00038]|uniref:sirohydrochlorin chelatase n=1 Tax=Nocardioides sp. SYSU D00038 TaxID=2812554 RepID=UPI001968751A|nr:sirohydrochlorin chelatase [Nocardioides sp. SYSU D00038]
MTPLLVTVAHGTRHPTGNRVAAELTARAGALLGVEALASYVELCAPSLASVVAGLAPQRPAVVVPLLLSTGHHVRHDLPAMAGGRPLGRPLGPDPLVAEAQADRLVEAGARPGSPVTLVAAGSSDPAALDDLHDAAALLADRWGGPVRLATLSGLGPRPADVVRPGDAVSPYLLAPGFFAGRARDAALTAGAAVVADVIGVHPAVVRLVAARAGEGFPGEPGKPALIGRSSGRQVEVLAERSGPGRRSTAPCR